MRPTTPTTAQDALLACHARMRAFCDGLARMEALPSLDDPRVPDAAAQAERYFRVGLPLHAEDEEMTLAPLLVKATAVDPSLTEALARQTAEHDRIERLAAELCDVLADLAHGKYVPLATFAARSANFRALLLAHLDAEEREILPSCARLTEEDHASFAEAFRARRDRPA